jgi:RHS repeat-associated protein
MKKIYLTAILLVFSVLSFAQIIQRDSTKLDSTKVKALAAAAASTNADYIPDVIPPSANAASLGKYGDISVSYYVGLPNTPLNLYTIQSKDLSLPISLSYHHSGIKVEEEASNVGLGFSINQGGVITRTIFGLDDLRNKGIPFHQIPAVPETDTYFKNNLADPLWGTPGVDTQPDIFYFNVGGISGKFILASGSAFPLQGIPLDRSDVSITCKLLSTGSNPPTFGGNPQYQWEIITPNGIKYTFTQQEISVLVSATTTTPYTPQYYFNNLSNIPSFEYNSVRSGHQISSWYLTQVYSTNTLNTITLNYDNDAPYYSTSRISANEVYQKSFLENTGPGCISPATLMNKNSGFHYNATMTRNAYLKSIVFDNGSVEFALSDREDIQQYFPSGNGALTFPISVNTGDIDDVSSYASAAKKPQKIQTILVKDATGSLLKKFEFTYSYFNSSVVGAFPASPTFSDNMLKYNNLRLRLDKVQETDNLGTSYLPAHQFRYVGDILDANGNVTTPVTLPAKTSWAKDYYGFYNGQDFNNLSAYAHIIPALAYPKMIGDKTFSGSYFFTNIGFSNTFSLGINRDVDTTYEAYGALSHIYYPTGGHSKFDYSFHKAMGGAGEVEVDLYFATVNSTPPPLVVPTGDNNKYVADIEFRLDCSSYVPVPSSACVTSNANEDFSSIWYAKIQSFGNVFRNHLYSDWNNKICSTVGSNQTCTYVSSEFNVPIPTGTHQLSVNPATPTNGAFNLPVHSASMKYYKYHTTDYKEVVVGGLRIAKITDFTDATNIAKTRTFSYTGLAGTSTGKQLRPPVKYVFGYPEILRVQDEHSIYYTGQGWSVGCPVKNWEIEMNAFSLSPLGSSGTGNVIGYDQVSVSEVDGNNNPNGYQVFQYHNEKDTFPNSLLFADIPSTPDLANGMLIHQTILDKDKAVIEETIPTISLKTTQSTLYQGMQFLAGSNTTGTALELAKAYYSIPAQFWFTSGETKRVYSGANYIETVSTNTYGSTQHNFMTQQTVVDSKGNTNATQNAYPADRVASGNDPTGVYALMVGSHLINPVIETKMLFNGFQYAKKLVNYYGWNSNSFFAPLSVQTQVKATDPLITQVSFLTYDARANLTKYSLRNGQTTALTWYGVTDLGKTDLLKTHTVGGGSTGTVLSRSMSYDYKPLVGLLTATDLNGYTLTNTFDAFSRLINVKDPFNFLLKDINYHYANQSALSGLGLTPTNTLNYIISRVAREAQTGTALDSDVDKTTTQISYMDGLGKSLQTQIWKGSPDKTKDLITATSLYDVYNRNHKNILPTPSDGILGAYKSTALNLANAFYGDTSSYTQTVFEPSPLNRPVKQFGAGQAWRATGNEKFVAMAYQLQGGGIGRFDIQSDGSVKWTNTYPASSLYSLATTSERGFVTYELKDKLGRVTHKFQQLKDGFTFAITAYVYSDSLNLLRYVISPEAYNQFGSNTEQLKGFTESDAVFKESCFGYVYDNQNRPIAKHIPGAGWRFSILDKQDHEILFADESDKSKGYWQFRKVDALSREILSGVIGGIGSTSRQTVQTAFNDFMGQNYETAGTGFYGYTNVSFPSGYVPVDSSIKEVKYYDDYSQIDTTGYGFKSAYSFHALGLSKGLMTGQLTRNLKTGTWQKTIMYYDYRGKLIQDFHLSNKGNIIRKDHQYRFNGELLKTRITKNGKTKTFTYEYNHIGNKVKFKHGIDGVEKTIANYSYDDINRLLQKSFSPSNPTGSKQTGLWLDNTTWLSGTYPTLNDKVTINSGHTVTIPSGQKVSAGMLMDNGILKNFGTLNLGNVKASTPSVLQTLIFKYHIRGLKGINLDASGNLTNNIFSYRLDYEEGTGGFFNGNIKKQSWKSSIDGKERSYTFDYDGASRLKSGLYNSTQTGENYSLNNVTYDLNGNITALSRNGATNNNFTSFGNVDNMAYTYQSNSNKLSKIKDSTTTNADLGDFRDGTNTDDDYEYWLDGSLKKDKNKKISSITYNYLKLPERITFDNGRTITTEYDANGTKLKKIDSNGETTDYEEDDIYVNNVLYQTSHDEGRVANGIYEYNINDHLGNLRVSFRDSSGIVVPVQSLFYDPWGLTMKGMQISRNTVNFNHFQFLNREIQIETGLVDLNNRQYDPVRGQFTSIDPLSELTKRFSPFVYGNNNPLRFNDPEGMAATESIGADGLTNSQWLQNQGDEEKNKESQQENRDKENGKKKNGKTVMVAFSGLDVSSTSKPKTAGSIVKELEAWAMKKGKKFKGIPIASTLSDDLSVAQAASFIHDNYQEGDNLIIYGYSWGGDNAMELANFLDKLDINVQLLITVDASIGPASGFYGNWTDFVDRNNSKNVIENSNHYQSNGTFPVTSQGNINTTNSSNTRVYNVKYIGKSVNHYNIDVLSKDSILKYIKQKIGN